MEEKKNGAAVGGFVLGIISFLLGLIPGVCVVTLVLAIIGIVKSVKGMKLANQGQGKKALAIIGLILSILGVLGSLIGVGCTAACTTAACTGGLAALGESFAEVADFMDPEYYYYY